MTNKLLDFDNLKNRVLTWLQSLKVKGSRFDYKFSPTSGHSLFTTCFALFILDLFRETNKLSKQEKKDWAVYINSFQKKEDGLFYPYSIYHPDEERAVYQASCFCLSSLHILGSAPKHRLSVVDQWRTRDAVKDYLEKRGVHEGKGGSGNKAMFQAIFLTHEYEKTGDQELLNAVDEWFDFHKRNQNELGFWGNSKINTNRNYKGLQNAFHQFVIYEYWNRSYPNIDIVINNAKELQDREGFFAPSPGGAACKDYDSMHFILSKENLVSDKKLNRITNKSIQANFKCFNIDGGFCENIYKPYRFLDLYKLLTISTSINKMDITFYRLERFFKDFLKSENKLNRKWINESQIWSESTLWDTWFRCLLIAEVMYETNNTEWKENVRFHDHIGLGFKKI